MIPPPPSSTLFPYTTLFRSEPRPETKLMLQLLRLMFPYMLLACLAAVLKHQARSEEHTSELQSRGHLVCRLLLEKKKKKKNINNTGRYEKSLMQQVVVQWNM